MFNRSLGYTELLEVEYLVECDGLSRHLDNTEVGDDDDDDDEDKDDCRSILRVRRSKGDG
jgi:hypothetical protein